MRSAPVFVVFVILIVFRTSPSTAAAFALLTEPRVVVRTYDDGSLTADDRRSALIVAAEILETAGLDVHWQDCDAGVARPDTDACAPPLAANELAIRFVRLPARPNETGRLLLGYAIVDTQMRSGRLATIYVDRTAWLAHESGARPDIVLGRALAHEIGHLLLGTASHTRTGVMRAIWSKEALRLGQARDWQFSPDDARTMRDTLRARNDSRMAANLVR